jgi:hypothetical protein
VLGYSRLSDRVVQYPIEVVHGTQKSEIKVWIEHVFSTKPIRPGQWDLIWDPGHGAQAQIHDQVSFDRLRQQFVDRQEIIPYR